MYNGTVRNSQLIINTSDPCSQYYATVAPVCQGTVPVASIGGSQIPGGNIALFKLEVGGNVLCMVGSNGGVKRYSVFV